MGKSGTREGITVVAWSGTKWDWNKDNRELWSLHVRFEVTFRNPGRHVKRTLGYTSLNFKAKVNLVVMLSKRRQCLMPQEEIQFIGREFRYSKDGGPGPN